MKFYVFKIYTRKVVICPNWEKILIFTILLLPRNNKKYFLRGVYYDKRHWRK